MNSCEIICVPPGVVTAMAVTSCVVDIERYDGVSGITGVTAASLA